MTRRIFVASHATGHICTGASCPACNPDNQDAVIAAMVERALASHAAQAPLAPSRGVLSHQRIAAHRDDNVVLLPPRYITK
ncbi:MAG: hypothetical protein GEU87_20160 [Alphaproteobacteria bacterium]|nr:hypothetical protein [Alphaproteobacteria bacterium]